MAGGDLLPAPPPQPFFIGEVPFFPKKPSFVDTLKNSIHTDTAQPLREPVHSYIDDSKLSLLSKGFLQLKPSAYHLGKPAVIFQKSDKIRLISGIKNVLIAKFSHGRPPIELIHKFLLQSNVKGNYTLSVLDVKHLIIEFSVFEDFSRIWLKRNWVIKTFPVRFFKWSADFLASKESSIVPVWVHLPRLPLYLFEEEALLSIANAIGKPLHIDKANLNRTKLGYATFCVEMDVSQPLFDELWIEFKEECPTSTSDGFWQRIVYDDIPPFCVGCQHLGHKWESCKRRPAVDLVHDMIVEKDQDCLEGNVDGAGRITNCQPLSVATSNPEQGDGRKGLKQLNGMLVKRFVQAEIVETVHPLAVGKVQTSKEYVEHQVHCRPVHCRQTQDHIKDNLMDIFTPLKINSGKDRETSEIDVRKSVAGEEEIGTPVAEPAAAVREGDAEQPDQTLHILEVLEPMEPVSVGMSAPADATEELDHEGNGTMKKPDLDEQVEDADPAAGSTQQTWGVAANHAATIGEEQFAEVLPNIVVSLGEFTGAAAETSHTDIGALKGPAAAVKADVESKGTSVHSVATRTILGAGRDEADLNAPAAGTCGTARDLTLQIQELGEHCKSAAETKDKAAQNASVSGFQEANAAGDNLYRELAATQETAVGETEDGVITTGELLGSLHQVDDARPVLLAGPLGMMGRQERIEWKTETEMVENKSVQTLVAQADPVLESAAGTVTEQAVQVGRAVVGDLTMAGERIAAEVPRSDANCNQAGGFLNADEGLFFDNNCIRDTTQTIHIRSAVDGSLLGPQGNSHTASITPQKLSSAAAEFTPKWAVLVEELVEGKKQSDHVLDEKEKSANVGGQVVMVTNYAMDQLNERMRRLRGEPAAPILTPILATSTWVPPSMSKHLARELKKNRKQHRSNQNWLDIEDYSDVESEEGDLEERAGSQMLKGEAFLSDGMGDIPRPFKIKSAPNSPKGKNSSYDSSTYLLSRKYY